MTLNQPPAWADRIKDFLSLPAELRRFEAARKGDELTLDVLDFIGSDWLFEGVTAKRINEQLKSLGEAKSITVQINSPGGIMAEGVAIHSLLQGSGANVTTHVLGEASSAASMIFMAGSRRTMAPGSWVMIHAASFVAYGNATEFRKSADILDEITSGAVDLYARATGIDKKELAKMVEQETWMTAERAVELGFAHEIVGPKQAKDAGASRAKAFSLPWTAAAVAAARTQPTAPPPATEQQEDNPMSFSLIAKALGLPESAGEVEIVTAANQARGAVAIATMFGKVEASTGKTGEEALGVIKAWKESHDKLPGVEKELASVTAEKEATELETFIANARSGAAFKDGKPRLTKNSADKLTEQIKSGEMSIRAARAFVEALSPVTHLSEKPEASTGKKEPGAAAEKSFAEMSGPERAALKRKDPQLYAELRAAHQDSQATN